MLTVLIGENRLELLAELERDLAKRKLPHAARFSEDSFAPEEILASLEQIDLVAVGGQVLVLDSLASFAEGKAFLESEAERFATSSRAVYLLETSLPAALSKAISSIGGEVRAIGREGKRKGPPPVFALSDALILRDKKALWITYQDISRGAEAEEMVGVLIWQMKAIWLTLLGETSSLSPYVVSKSRAALKSYKKEEVQKLHYALVTAYHKAHRGEGSLSTSLEQLILSL